MKKLPPSKNIFIQKGHVEPIRFYVKNGESRGALFDLQIKPELRDLNNPVKQEHSLSVYIKPPVNAHYKLVTKDYSVTDRGDNIFDYKLIDVGPKEELFNPYVSWHGSGEVHANAHELVNGKWKTKRIVTEKDAISWQDVRMAYNLILRAIIPVKAVPLQNLKLDPNETLDFVSQNAPKGAVKNIVFDSRKLVRETVVVDVFVHNRAYGFSDQGQLPYPNNSEMMWLAPPIKFENSASVFLPAVSIFAFQPTGIDGEYKRRPSLIMEGITLKHPYEEIYISAKHSDK